MNAISMGALVSCFRESSTDYSAELKQQVEAERARLDKIKDTVTSRGWDSVTKKEYDDLDDLNSANIRYDGGGLTTDSPACLLQFMYVFTFNGVKYEFTHESARNITIKNTATTETFKVTLDDNVLNAATISSDDFYATKDKSGLVEFDPHSKNAALPTFYLPKDIVGKIIENNNKQGGSRSILYKGHLHKLRTEGRSKFITSKGARVPLADVRAWQKSNAAKK